MKKISSLEYNTFIWFIIRSCFAELTLTQILHITYQDSWISIIIGSILGLIPFFIFEYLKLKYPDENIISLNEKLLKNFGKFLNFLILIGSIIGAICVFWIFIHFSNSLFLYKTNLWTTSIIFILPIAYAVTKGLHVLGKVSLILFYISVFFNITIMLGLTNGIDISNFKPILDNNIFNIFDCSVIFIGVNIAQLFFLTIIPKNDIINYSKKNNLIFYIITCLNLLDILFLTISIFGIDLSTLYEYPGFQILKRVNILGVFDRMESILSIEALLSLFIRISLMIFYAKEIITQTFKLNEKTNKYITTFICLIVVILSNTIFITHEEGENFFTGPLLYIVYFICIIIPLITAIKSLKDFKIIKDEHYYPSN